MSLQNVSFAILRSIFAVRMVDGVHLSQDRDLKWYDASDIGERAFCSNCGGTLFGRSKDCGPGQRAVSAGTLPNDAVPQIFEHIWNDIKALYYEFAENAPRRTTAKCLDGAPELKPNESNDAN